MKKVAHTADYEHCDYLGQVIQTELLQKTADKLVKTLKDEVFDAIAFSGMSGALIVPILALKLGKTMIMVRKDDGSHSSYEVEGDTSNGSSNGRSKA